MSRDKVKTVYSGMKSVDVVFAGIGTMTGDSNVWPLQDFGVSQAQLKGEGVIGDISYCFFDSKGNTRPEWDYFLTLGIEHLRGMVVDRKRML